jgi:ElaA protein
MKLEWTNVSFTQFSLEELYAVLRLRQEVFVVEQNSPYLDCDGLDQQATHMLCREGDTFVAYQRCLPPGLKYPESSIGRVIVSRQLRGQQLGRELAQRGVDFNLLHWPNTDICISAQAHLQGFYGSLGFIAEGDKYSEDGIPHRKMRYRVQ